MEPPRAGSGDLVARIRRISTNSMVYRVMKVLLYCVSPFVVFGVLQVLFYIASTPLILLLIGAISLVFAYGPDLRRLPSPPSSEASPAILTPAGDHAHAAESGDIADERSEPTVSLERPQNPSKRSYLDADANSSKVPSHMQTSSKVPLAEMVQDKSLDVKEVVQLHPPPVVTKLGLAIKSENKIPSEQKVEADTTNILPDAALKNSLRYVPLVYQSSEYNSQDQIESLTSILDKSGEGENIDNGPTINNNSEVAAETIQLEQKGEYSPVANTLNQAVISESQSPSKPVTTEISESDQKPETKAQRQKGPPVEPVNVNQGIDDSGNRSPVEYHMRVFQDNTTNTPIPDMESIVNAEIKLVEDLRSDVSSKKPKDKAEAEPLIPHNGNTDAETVPEITLDDNSQAPIPTTSILDSVLQYFPFVNRPSDTPDTQNQTEADEAILNGPNNNAEVPQIIEAGLDAKIEISEPMNFADYFPTKPKEPQRGTKPEDIAIPFSSLPTGKISSLNPMVVNFKDGIDDTFHLAVDHPELFLINSPSQELD